MKYETREFINELAEAVRNSFDIDMPITDMREVVNRIGGRLTETQDISRFSSGYITKNDDSFRIVVPQSQSDKRKNFTIAHELGHLFLHMGYQIDDELWAEQGDTEYHRHGTSETEMEANEFAAAFLMPRDTYRKVLQENIVDGKRVNTTAIAQYFNVSLEAASNRGKWLGYLRW